MLALIIQRFVASADLLKCRCKEIIIDKISIVYVPIDHFARINAYRG